MKAKGNVKQLQIEATVIRADGTVIPLGLIVDSRWKWYKPWTYKTSGAARNRILQANKGV